MKETKNIVWQNAIVTRQKREMQNNHKGVIVWFTGLSGSGKSTLAHALEDKLYEMGCKTFVLDGDNVRHGLCKDLGFSDKDREENIRRVGELAKLFMEAGIIVITAFISPFRADRQVVRDMVVKDDFVEIYCDTPIEICEKRDVKGLYKKARKGEIQNFTGISSPYEQPNAPDISVKTANRDIEKCVEELLKQLIDNGTLNLV